MTDRRAVPSWTSTANIVAGIWLIIAPFVLMYGRGAAQVNDIVLGAVIGVFALIRTFAPGPATAWLSWLNALWGVWLIIAPFVIVYYGVARTNDIVLGIIVLILALWSAGSSTVRRTNTTVAR